MFIILQVVGYFLGALPYSQSTCTEVVGFSHPSARAADTVFYGPFLSFLYAIGAAARLPPIAVSMLFSLSINLLSGESTDK
jgi:hypothetical protein